MTDKRKMTICKLIHWALVRENVAHVAQLQEKAFATNPQRLGFASGNAVFELGTHIDSSTQAAKIAGAHCHPDAMLVWEAICMLENEAKSLVIKHGRTDSFPNFAPEGIGKEEPIRGKNGQLKKRFKDQRNQRGFIGYKTEWVGLTAQQVKFHRAEYKLWRSAVVLMYAYLKPQLVDVVLQKSVPALTPWKKRRNQRSCVAKSA